LISFTPRAPDGEVDGLLQADLGVRVVPVIVEQDGKQDRDDAQPGPPPFLSVWIFLAINVSSRPLNFSLILAGLDRFPEDPGSEIGMGGTLRRNRTKQSAVSPKNPAVIRISSGPMGIQPSCQMEGATRMNRSSHIPIKMRTVSAIIGPRFNFILRFNSTKKGTIRIMKRATQARGSQGLSFTRRMT
jgi:hypothetical protein